MNRKISAQVTIYPPTMDQIEWGLKGALEAIDKIIAADGASEFVKKLRENVSNQLEGLGKN